MRPALVLLYLTVLLAVLAARRSNAESTKVIGIADLRPSWSSNDGKIYGENLVEAGYRISPKLSLSYQQQFLNNFYNSSTGGGLDARLYDGFVRAKIDDIWSPREYKVYFSYEPRVYLPTDQAKADNGMVTMIRNYFKIRSQVSSSLAFHYMEVPIVHLYSRAGGAEGANPFLENRIYFGPELSWLAGNLTLFVPVMFSNTRFSDFQPGAKNNDSWSHHLDIYPELMYQMSPNLALGIAYYSGNLIAPDLSGFDIGQGLKKGITQLVFQIGL